MSCSIAVSTNSMLSMALLLASILELIVTALASRQLPLPPDRSPGASASSTPPSSGGKLFRTDMSLLDYLVTKEDGPQSKRKQMILPQMFSRLKNYENEIKRTPSQLPHEQLYESDSSNRRIYSFLHDPTINELFQNMDALVGSKGNSLKDSKTTHGTPFTTTENEIRSDESRPKKNLMDILFPIQHTIAPPRNPSNQMLDAAQSKKRLHSEFPSLDSPLSNTDKDNLGSNVETFLLGGTFGDFVLDKSGSPVSDLNHLDAFHPMGKFVANDDTSHLDSHQPSHSDEASFHNTVPQYPGLKLAYIAWMPRPQSTPSDSSRSYASGNAGAKAIDHMVVPEPDIKGKQNRTSRQESVHVDPVNSERLPSTSGTASRSDTPSLLSYDIDQIDNRYTPTGSEAVFNEVVPSEGLPSFTDAQPTYWDDAVPERGSFGDFPEYSADIDFNTVSVLHHFDVG